MLIKKIKKKLGNLLHEYMNSKMNMLVISYPKSGRTWLRVLIGKYYASHFGLEDKISENPDLLLDPRDLHALNKQIPSVYFSHDDTPHDKPTRDINTDKSEFYNKKIIFLYRDPRDVAVSQYFSLTKRTDVGGYKGTISDFVRDEAYGPLNHITYMNIWAEQMVQ